MLLQIFVVDFFGGFDILMICEIFFKENLTTCIVNTRCLLVSEIWSLPENIVAHFSLSNVSVPVALHFWDSDKKNPNVF